jgi:hypothetical protein
MALVALDSRAFDFVCTNHGVPNLIKQSLAELTPPPEGDVPDV